jgi:hypothetical protein
MKFTPQQQLRHVLCLALGAFWCVAASASETVIKVNNASGAKAGYMIAMLNLALNHIDQKYRLEPETVSSTQARLLSEVESGALDILWATTSSEMEQKFTPIRIPLMKGLLGYRVLIIREGDQEQFDGVRSLEDLKKIKLGQGRNWADTTVLEKNDLQVIQANKMPSLFYMLDGGRFDAFPRGVSEAFDEVKKYPQLKLAVEKNLLLTYKMPIYFFVTKNNLTLAKNIELGLNRAIADGSFEQLFLSNPSIQTAIQQGNLAGRRTLHLTNPILPKETPTERGELWLDPLKFN